MSLTFAGPYEVVDILGIGVSSTVYRAKLRPGVLSEQTLSQSEVALKEHRLSSNSENDSEETIRYWQREAACLRYLQHPHVISYIEHFRNSRGLYLVTELMAGGSIRQLLNKCGKLDEARVATIIRQLLRTLAYLHSVGIVHRDIKAANVFLDESGESVKLGDFGIAVVSSSGNQYHPRVPEGTAYWMAPEIATGGPPGFPADIWAIGALTLELLRGDPPFHERSIPNALYHIASLTAPPFEEWTSPVIEVSDSLSTFLSAIMQPDPTRRPTSDELLRQFQWIAVPVTDDPVRTDEELPDTLISLGGSVLDTVHELLSDPTGEELLQWLSCRKTIPKQANLRRRARTSIQERVPFLVTFIKKRCHLSEISPFINMEQQREDVTCLVQALCAIIESRCYMGDEGFYASELLCALCADGFWSHCNWPALVADIDEPVSIVPFIGFVNRLFQASLEDDQCVMSAVQSLHTILLLLNCESYRKQVALLLNQRCRFRMYGNTTVDPTLFLCDNISLGEDEASSIMSQVRSTLARGLNLVVMAAIAPCLRSPPSWDSFDAMIELVLHITSHDVSLLVASFHPALFYTIILALQRAGDHTLASLLLLQCARASSTTILNTFPVRTFLLQAIDEGQPHSLHVAHLRLLLQMSKEDPDVLSDLSTSESVSLIAKVMISPSGPPDHRLTVICELAAHPTIGNALADENVLQILSQRLQSLQDDTPHLLLLLKRIVQHSQNLLVVFRAFPELLVALQAKSCSVIECEQLTRELFSALSGLDNHHY